MTDNTENREAHGRPATPGYAAQRDVLTEEETRSALRAIGLALCATHNTVTTDIPGMEPEPGRSWRVDHVEEIAALDRLERALLANTDTSL